MSTREMLKTGAFNGMTQKHNNDKSVTIILTRINDPKQYKLTVVDLYLPTERIINDTEVLSNDKPKRMP